MKGQMLVVEPRNRVQTILAWEAWPTTRHEPNAKTGMWSAFSSRADQGPCFAAWGWDQASTFRLSGRAFSLSYWMRTEIHTFGPSYGASGLSLGWAWGWEESNFRASCRSRACLMKVRLLQARPDKCISWEWRLVAQWKKRSRGIRVRSDLGMKMTTTTIRGTMYDFSGGWHVKWRWMRSTMWQWHVVDRGQWSW